MHTSYAVDFWASLCVRSWLGLYFFIELDKYGLVLISETDIKESDSFAWEIQDDMCCHLIWKTFFYYWSLWKDCYCAEQKWVQGEIGMEKWTMNADRGSSSIVNMWTQWPNDFGVNSLNSCHFYVYLFYLSPLAWIVVV